METKKRGVTRRRKIGGIKTASKPMRMIASSFMISKGDEDIMLKNLDKEFRDYLKEYNFPVRISRNRTTFTEYLMDNLLIVQIIKKGITYSVFQEIHNLSPFTTSDWAEVLNLSTKSLSRYKTNDQLFKPIHSEKIIELAEIFILGKRVFGENEKFKLWLHIPNYALGNLKPKELLGDSYGKELVINELNRIDHGILA